LYDADGNRYIDWMMAYGALPLGHAHPEVVRAVAEGASTGMHFAAATEIELEVAEQIQKVIPNAERIRFANTGTEAVMAAIRLARGFTGRSRILKFEGHYHGWYDDVLVNSNPQLPASLGFRSDPVKIPDSSGLNPYSLRDTIVVPWNDTKAVEKAIHSHRGQIAAVITEGVMANMGVIPPRQGYLQFLREITKSEDILLILDETVTGFRIAPGGCQSHYGIKADIATFGKALGCGLPVAAFTGRRDVMEALVWGGVLHYGTQNASRLGLHAAKACLDHLLRDEAAAFEQIWAIGGQLCESLRDSFRRAGIPAVVQNVGPMLQILFTEKEEIQDYREFCTSVDREKFQLFALALIREGIYLSPSAALHSVVSTTHTLDNVSITQAAVDRVLKRGIGRQSKTR
jgi:glutamate-1-semialdehyde 2,1-aminomutase